ncbi:hypothetical protein KC350_g14555, partial [Hortaea werneckii]
EKNKPKKDDSAPKSPMDLEFMDDPVKYITEKFDLFLAIAQRDPVEAVRFVPEIAAGLAVGAVTLVLILSGLLAGGSKAAPSKEELKAQSEKAKQQAQKTKEQVADAVASGKEQAGEAAKRNTRSSAGQ